MHMKVNISDLLDDFSPDQEMDFLDNNKDKINLKTVRRSVNKRISRSKGGHFMHYSIKTKIAMACIAGIVVLSLGGITVNAATHGELLKSLRVVFQNKDGTEEAYEMENSYIDENGNTVAEYATKDGGKFSVRIIKDDSNTSVETDDKSISSVSITNKVSDSGQIEDKKVTISEDVKPSSVSKDIGIDAEKYRNYKPGTYEETNKAGIKYEIIVSKDGSINIHSKK